MRKVLIVEDDKDIRETLQQMLELEGYEVLTAKNGQEGLNIAREGNERPRLILLDLMMPVMTGWDFLVARREDKELSQVPVIVVSAVANRGELLDVTAILPKPVEVDCLLAAVARYGA